MPTPAQIHAALDEYVVGQDDAKKVLSVAVYNHYKRIQSKGSMGAELSKSNILMIGPTGCGKTHVTSTLARTLEVPFASADATMIISSGGREMENVLKKLVDNAGGDIEKAQKGIIYIDEIDKLASRYTQAGESIQQGLLKTVEGSLVAGVDTSDILFIVGGAFVDLDFIVRERMGGGFINFSGIMISELIKNVTPVDLKKYGIIPELVGRLPVIVGLNELNRDTLIDILYKPKNALVQQYQKMLAMDGIELLFQRSALERIAELAKDLRTGARGLRTVMESRMRDVMYSAPNEKNLQSITITADVIANGSKPVYDYVFAKEDFELVDPQKKIAKAMSL